MHAKQMLRPCHTCMCFICSETKSFLIALASHCIYAFMQSFPACASGFLASVNFGLGQLAKLVLVAVIVLLRKLNDFDVVGHHSLGVEGVLALFIKAKGCRVVWIPDQFLHLNVPASHLEIEP